MKVQGNYPVPVILMARFAVDQAEQGKGIGADLFKNALYALSMVRILLAVEH
jgi:predicted N-acetyltransferase YhbS